MTGQAPDREALARVLHESGSCSEQVVHVCEDLADDLLASDWHAKVVREAEQRGLRDWAEAMDEWLDAHPGHDLSAEDVAGNALARAAVLARHAGADQ